MSARESGRQVLQLHRLSVLFPFQTSLEMLHRQVLNAAERETKATRPTTVEVSLDYQGQLLQLKMPLQVSLMK